MIDLGSNVYDLELSVRALNCLQMANIHTVGELVQRREGDLLKTKNFGRKCLREVKEALAEHGLHLKDSMWAVGDPEPFSLDSSPHALGLPYTVVSNLRWGRINTVGELIQRTKRDLLRVQGIGVVRVKLIKDALKTHGLHLAEEPETDKPPEDDPVTSSAALTAAIKQLAAATERLVALLEKTDIQK
jgi:DNA-directed RNA polymerase alpha subunit